MKTIFAIFSLLFFAILSPVHGGPHIVFLLGEKEYGTLESVPKFYEEDLKTRGYTATFITASHEDDVRDDFDGMAEALEKADLCFVSLRRRAPASDDMEALKKFVASGKPIVAIRTSSHAFHLRGKPAPDGRALWEEFDPEILGGNYHGHYGDEMAKVSIAKGAENHPILAGVKKLPDSDKLYQAKPLLGSTSLLLEGAIEGKEPEPVAWTNLAGDKEARIFYTSLGQVGDFADPGFRQFLVNAVAWALQ